MSAILRWGPPLSHYIGVSSLLAEDRVENLYDVTEDEGALSIVTLGRRLVKR